MMLDEELTDRLLLAHWAVLDENLNYIEPFTGYQLDTATVLLVVQ